MGLSGGKFLGGCSGKGVSNPYPENPLSPNNPFRKSNHLKWLRPVLHWVALYWVNFVACVSCLNLHWHHCTNPTWGLGRCGVGLSKKQKQLDLWAWTELFDFDVSYGSDSSADTVGPTVLVEIHLLSAFLMNLFPTHRGARKHGGLARDWLIPA